jgi:hypothetical protein
MNTELENFLCHNGACAGIVARLENLGAETLEQAWEKASPEDLVWIVTRPGVMSPEQRRQFLVFVLESIEDKLTDHRSKNILDKLRTNSPITDNDKKAAWDASETAAREALLAAARSLWAAWAAVADAVAQAAARNAQAKWIRENVKLSDLHIN